MRYHATIGGKDRLIDLESLGGSQFRVTLDEGTPKVVDAEHLEGSVVHLLMDGNSYEADLEQDGEGLNVLLREEIYRLEILDDRKHRMRKAGGKLAVAGPQMVRAPMPGKIVKILVEKGADVAEGQGVIIIEAMKMENELRAAKAGKVAAILVTEGQTVDNRADLVSIE